MLLITTAPPPKLVNADKVSDKFNNFLARCLKMDADERPSAEELLEDELFKDQNHKAVMAGLLAEYRINKLVNISSDSLSDKQNTDDDDGSCVLVEEALEVFEEDPRRPVMKRTESVRSTSSNSSSLGTISHGDIDKIAFINTIVKQKKQWAYDTPALSLSYISLTRTHTHTLSHFPQLCSLRLQSSPSRETTNSSLPPPPPLSLSLCLSVCLAGAHCSQPCRPDVEESILAMEELMTALQDQLNEEKIMTSDAAFYKGISYQKLVREIKEMNITVAELQKKVDSYKRSNRGKSKK